MTDVYHVTQGLLSASAFAGLSDRHPPRCGYWWQLQHQHWAFRPVECHLCAIQLRPVIWHLCHVEVLRAVLAGESPFAVCWAHFTLLKEKERKKKVTLFSDHNGSLLRRQPENIVEAFCVAWCLLPFPWTYVVCCCCVKTHRSQHSGKFVITILHLPSKPHFSQLSTQYL